MAAAIVSVQDFVGANYDAIFSLNSPLDHVYRLFAHPRVPVYAVVAYLLLSTVVFKAFRSAFNIQPKGPFMQFVTITHSALLAVYSGWTFYNSAMIVVPRIMEYGFYTTLCDVDGQVWHQQGLGFWITHFYLSKFYEFIDTWIVLLKGRTPIFLQTYHHAGIVILMWGFVATANTAGGAVTTVFNSFIHTLMYTYYTLSAFGYSSPLKHYLTQAQMVQFIVGIALTVPTHFIGGCVNQAQSLVIAAIQLYAVVLIILFYQFYVNSYAKKKEDGNKKAVKKDN